MTEQSSLFTHCVHFSEQWDLVTKSLKSLVVLVNLLNNFVPKTRSMVPFPMVKITVGR